MFLSSPTAHCRLNCHCTIAPRKGNQTNLWNPRSEQAHSLPNPAYIQTQDGLPCQYHTFTSTGTFVNSQSSLQLRGDDANNQAASAVVLILLLNEIAKNHPHVHMVAINNATHGDAPGSTQQLSHSVATALTNQMRMRS